VSSEDVQNSSTDALVAQIVACLIEADAGGHYVAAAHLDAALVALRGYGVEPILNMGEADKKMH